MNYLPRFALILALGLSCGLVTTIRSQTKAPKKPQTNSVSGRVTIRGKAAPGVVVSVRSSNFSQPTPASLKGTTDNEGNYQIVNIPPGNYQVLPLAPTLVSQDSLMTRGPFKTLLLGENEDVTGIDFSLMRGAVITGKVTTSDGQPVVEERLTLTPADQPDQRRGFQTVGSGFMTDDRGIYRMYGLLPGRYKISIGVSDELPFGPVRFGRITYQRTFYPDVTDVAEAKIIELAEGAEANNIDITVGRNLPSFTATGKIVDGETDKPLAGVRFNLRKVSTDRAGGPMMGVFIVSNSQGGFRIENITPGSYAVMISPQSNSEVRAEPVFFEVVDQDVTGLLMKTIQGFSVTGVLSLEGPNDANAFAKLPQLRLRAYVQTEAANFGVSREATINSDGSFRLGGLSPGKAHFSISGSDRREPSGFSIQRVERDGVVTQGGLEIKFGENIAGVKIVLNYGRGSVKGEVKLVSGPLPSGGHINVWLSKPSDPQWRFRPTTVDARGHFFIEGVPAGDYEVNVNANFPRVRSSPSAKQLITVGETGVSNVEITLDPKPTPAPN